MTVKAYMKRPISQHELDKLRDMAHAMLSIVQDAESKPAVPSIEDDGITKEKHDEQAD